MITFDQVSHRFGALDALSALSLHIESGIVGLLGPNGAGKSTALRLAAGYLCPSAGQIRICGRNPAETAARVAIGYLPDGAPLLADATVIDLLDFVSRIRGGTPGARSREQNRLMERLGLSELAHRRSGSLSKGQRRRVALAASVLGEPRVLLLDEPTDGLDPVQRDEVHDLIRELAPNRAILISSHLLDEAEQLCHRALIIGNGRLLADDTPAALAARSLHHEAVSLTWSATAAAIPQATLIRALGSVAAVEMDPAHPRLTAIARPGHRPLADIAALIAQNSWAVDRLEVDVGRLEEIFKSLTGGGGP
jgi:ABC-2 type transport system ATP-binding protein